MILWQCKIVLINIGHCPPNSLSSRHITFWFILRTQEYEKKIFPWLWTFAVFTILRFLASLFFAIVNDLIFAYNILMVLLWIVFLIGCGWSWLVVYTLYVELSGLSKLEDLAQLRVSWCDWGVRPNTRWHRNRLSFIFQMGTMASVHASTNPSLAGSRPTTPYTTSTIHWGGSIHRRCIYHQTDNWIIA